MDAYTRLNIRPNFRQSRLPCDGRVGDLLMLTPLEEGEFDRSPVGVASLWVCTKANWEREGLNAVWMRVAFTGFATCEHEVGEPPQDLPNLARG